MKKLLAVAVCAGTIGVTTAALSRVADAAPVLDVASVEVHLALKETAPKSDEMLSASPSKVTLWFTQAPQMSGTSVRLLPKGGEPLDLEAATASEDDPMVVVLGIPEALDNGEYRVMWRAMAQDGHTIRGDFGFMVHAQR